MEVLEQVPLEAVIVEGQNVRREADEEMVQSLGATGLVQPIRVVRRDDKFLLVAGSRRLAAAKKLGWGTIAAVVVDKDVVPGGSMVEESLAENVFRKGLSSIEEAEAIEMMLKEGYSVDDVARKFSRTDRWVTDRVALLRLPQELRDKLHEGKCTIQAGLVFLRLRSEELRKEALERILAGNSPWSVLSSMRYYEHAGVELGEGEEIFGECEGCEKRGASMPQLFDSYGDPESDENFCYDPDCYAELKEKYLKLSVEKFVTAGFKLVSIETRKEELKEEGVERSGIDEDAVGWVRLSEVEALGVEECENCEKRGVVLETGVQVCLDRGCFKNLLARRKREEAKAERVERAERVESGEEVEEEPREIYPRATRLNVHQYERNWLENGVIRVYLGGATGLSLTGLNFSSEFLSVFLLIGYLAQVSSWALDEALKKDGFESYDSLMDEVLALDLMGRSTLGCKVIAGFVKECRLSHLYALGQVLRLHRREGYQLQADFLPMFTKRALHDMASEIPLELKSTLKKQEMIDLLVGNWPVGVLPKVVKSEWEEYEALTKGGED